MDGFEAYIVALYKNWIWFMAGLPPLVLDRILKQWLGSKYEVWMAKWIAPSARQKLFPTFAVLAVFLAGFAAFNDERSQLIISQRTIDNLSNKRERTYKPLTDKQETDFLDKMRPLVDPGQLNGVYSVDNPSSVKIAARFRKILKKINFNTYSAPAQIDDLSETGFTLFIRNPTHPSISDQAYVSAFRLSGIAVEVKDLEEEDTFPDRTRFCLVISFPPV